MLQYFEQRAAKNLLITDGTIISQQGYGWYNAPGIWREDQIKAWVPIVEAVHKKGAFIACQLWHLGRQMHSVTSGEPIVAASPIPLKGQVSSKEGKKDPEVPQELSIDGIKQLIEDFGNAAENAIHKAGFDMVEVHGANGYILDTFLQSSTNIRKDVYGGSLENRLRIVEEVVDRVTKNVPANQVGYRISPNGVFGEMGSADNIETFEAVIRALGRRNIAYIHVMDGLGFGFHNLCEKFTLERARRVLQEEGSHTALIGNVGYTAETAEKEIAEGNTDLIAFGRPYIVNPDLVGRLEKNIAWAEVSGDIGLWNSADGEKNYIDFPAAT